MPVKHFVINPNPRRLTEDERRKIKSIELKKYKSIASEEDKRNRANDSLLEAEETLIHPDGRVVIKVNVDGKNTHRFSNGVVIRRERQFDNFNRRETEAANAICISGEGIKAGAEILIHHNATTEPYRITNYKQTTGSDIQYYSIPTEQCFLWLDGDEWKPLPPYETALRVFKPYTGIIEGIEPTLLKDTLFVTSGELNGQVVKTVIAADYTVVFQDTNGKEGKRIRFRPFGDPTTNKEEEAIAILHEETEMVNDGRLLVGYELSDVKKLNDAD